LPRNGERPQLTDTQPQTSAVEDQPGLAPPASEPAVPILPARPEPRDFSRWLLSGAVILSGLLHVAGAAAMLLGDSALPDYGVVTQQTDAISVELTASTILEAVESTASIAVAASVPTATQEGNPTPSSAAAVPLTKVEESAVETPMMETVKVAEIVPVTPPDDPLQVVKGAGEPSEVVDAKVAQQTKEEEQKQQEKKEKTEKEKEEVKVEQQQAAPQVSGGVTARSTASAESQAKVSASRGSILSYAAGIRAKVARNKPTGFGRSGEVEISFGVTPTGDLSYANLAQSSGNTRLDEAALEAIRRSAPFGPPPADATPSQLRFSIPFYFR
jgi:periplasmic protein TonB